MIFNLLRFSFVMGHLLDVTLPYMMAAEDLNFESHHKVCGDGKAL